MESKAIIEIGNVVNKMLANRDEEIATLEKQIPEDAAAITVAEAAMQTASDTGDVNAYQKAKAARRDAADIKEMHETRKAKLEEKPLIPRAEYEKIISDIYAEVDRLEDVTKEKLFKLASEMKDAAEEFEEVVFSANKILVILQRDVYKDADRKRDRTGEIIRLQHENRTLNKSLIIDWGKEASLNTLYKRSELKIKSEEGK